MVQGALSFFISDGVGPGQHPRTQDFTLSMPASGETIEAFWAAPSLCTRQRHVFSLPGSLVSGTRLQVPKELHTILFSLQQGLHCPALHHPCPRFFSLCFAPPPRASCPSFSPGYKDRLPVAHISHFPTPNSLSIQVLLQVKDRMGLGWLWLSTN